MPEKKGVPEGNEAGGPAKESDDDADVPLTARKKMDGSQVSKGASVSKPAKEQEQGGTGRTRRRTDTAPVEQRSLRQRSAKEPAKKDVKNSSKGASGKSEKAQAKGADRGASKSGGRGSKSKPDEKKNDAHENDEEDEEVQEAVPDEEHVLVSFSAGDSFDPNSIVSLTPETTPEDVPKGFEFEAKVIKYNAERKILTLTHSITEATLAATFLNSVLKHGTSIACRDGKTCARIEETDAEWHRDQAWARPCPKSLVGQKVRWMVEVPAESGGDGEEKEHEGTIWGWLPADESDYFLPKEEGGEPGPLWRVKFSADIMDADLDENEMARALKMYSEWRKRRAEKDALRRDDGEVCGKRKKAEQGVEIDDDVPIIKRKAKTNAGHFNDRKDSPALDDDRPVALKKKRPSEALLKGADTNGDSSTVRHGKDHSDDAPAAKRPRDDSKDDAEKGKEGSKKNLQSSNGSDAKRDKSGTPAVSQRESEMSATKDADREKEKEKAKSVLKTEKSFARASDGTALGSISDRAGGTVVKLAKSEADRTSADRPDSGKAGVVKASKPVSHVNPGGVGADKGAVTAAKSKTSAGIVKTIQPSSAALPKAGNPLPVAPSASVKPSLETSKSGKPSGALEKPVPEKLAVPLPLPRAQPLPQPNAKPLPLPQSGRASDGNSSHDSGDDQWGKALRRAPQAHVKYGYAAIAMPDLHGVPLPYSGLEEEIEALFGPTVVRRKLLKESSESLESMVQAAKQASNLEECVRLTREEMKTMQHELEQETQLRRDRRAQDARQEEEKAKEAANQRRAAPAAAAVTPQVAAADSGGNIDHSNGDAEDVSERDRVEKSAKDLPVPPLPDTEAALEIKEASTAAATAAINSARGAHVVEEEGGAAARKQKPVVSGNLAGNVAKNFGWKGKSVKATKTTADETASRDKPGGSAAVAQVAPVAIASAHVSAHTARAFPLNHGSAKTAAQAGAQVSSGTQASSSAQASSSKASCSVEVRVSPESEDHLSSAVDFVKRHWKRVTEEAKEDSWFAYKRLSDQEFDLTPVWSRLKSSEKKAGAWVFQFEDMSSARVFYKWGNERQIPASVPRTAVTLRCDYV